MLSGRNTLRYALAGEAYRANIIRMSNMDISGCDHLVTTRHGLFAVNRDAIRLIAYGLFYGLTIHENLIFAFEACDAPHSHSARGRLVRLRRDADRIVAADVIATGLDNGCHQIDLIHGWICVTDTYNQRILRYHPDGGAPDVLRPIAGGGIGGRNGPDDWHHGYVHVNSIIAQGDDILLMLHNGADKTMRPSEIARLDRDWRLLDRTPVDGMGCHSFAVLEDDTILTCGSFAGELVSTGGTKVRVCDMMTRGLSVGDDVIVVGGTMFAGRETRDATQGELFFLDRDYRPLGSIPVPAPPMDIRRIDGRDRSLSGHVAALAGRTRTPVNPS